MKCTCDKQEVNEKALDYLYIRCKNCNGIIRRKKSICKYYLENGRCELAQQRNYGYRCYINGNYKECKNGQASEE